jgi:hypothetical protein
MFACCYKNSAIEPQSIAPEQHPIKAEAIQIRIPTKVHALLKEPGPGPTPVLPLNKVSPPTPDLTPDEIAKIKVNLGNIHSFVKDCWNQQTEVITEVWAKLQSEMNQNRQDSKNNTVKKFFENFYEVAALVETIGAFVFPPLAPAFVASAAICGTISALLCTNGSEVKNATGAPDVSGMAANHYEINDAWNDSMIKTIDYLIDNTNANRDVIFTTSDIKKEATLRTLITMDFPNSGTCYDNWLKLCKRIYKKNLVLQELAKSENQFLDLYFIQDDTSSYVEFGHVYQPCAAPTIVGCERKRPLTNEGVGLDAKVWANDEVLHYHKDWAFVQTTGTTNDDLVKSWLDASSAFVAKMPSAYIFPWAINNDTVYSQKYFLIEGFAKMRDDQNKPEYNLGSPDFLNWFFIDDGFGNITNINGVAFRYTTFRSGNYGHGGDIFLHAQQITNDIIDTSENNWKTTCLDYIFGPEDSRELNNKFQVYTGDLLIKNLPFSP